MFLHDQLGSKLLDAKSLREVYELLHGYPLIGDFMSYQTAIDLNYSSLLGFSENDFPQAGPGALRGIKKVFVDLGDYAPAEIVFAATPEPIRLFFRRNGGSTTACRASRCSAPATRRSACRRPCSDPCPLTRP